MAHFYSSVQGSRGPAHRTGAKSSGIEASAFGWDLGGTVKMRFDSDLDTDVLELYITRNNNKTPSLWATYAVVNDQLVLLTTQMPEALV